MVDGVSKKPKVVETPEVDDVAPEAPVVEAKAKTKTKPPVVSKDEYAGGGQATIPKQAMSDEGSVSAFDLRLREVQAKNAKPIPPDGNVDDEPELAALGELLENMKADGNTEEDDPAFKEALAWVNERLLGVEDSAFHARVERMAKENELLRRALVKSRGSAVDAASGSTRKKRNAKEDKDTTRYFDEFIFNNDERFTTRESVRSDRDNGDDREVQRIADRREEDEADRKSRSRNA